MSIRRKWAETSFRAFFLATVFLRVSSRRIVIALRSRSSGNAKDETTPRAE